MTQRDEGILAVARRVVRYKQTPERLPGGRGRLCRGVLATRGRGGVGVSDGEHGTHGVAGVGADSRQVAPAVTRHPGRERTGRLRPPEHVCKKCANPRGKFFRHISRSMIHMAGHIFIILI